jgi:hypothetical protein
MRIHTSMLVAGAILASHDYGLAETQNLPTRRAGLWEIRMVDESGRTPPQVMHQCIDAKTDQVMNAFSGGIGAEMCAKQDVRKVGSTLVIDAECNVGPMRSTSQSVVSGDFNSNYMVQMTTKVEGLPAAAAAIAGGKRTIQAKYVGACRKDQRPGDVVMSDGKTMNVLELKRMMGGEGGTGGVRPGARPAGTPAR